jgi:predicted exporter
MAAFAWRGTPLWNDDIAALNPASAQHLLANEALAQSFGAPDLRQLVMVVAPDAEAALHRSEAVADQLEELRRRGALASYEMAARFLPSREAQKRRLDALPDVQDLTVRLREAQRGLPFKPGLFQPFLDDIQEAHRQGPIGLADIAGTPFAAKVTSLLFPLRNNWVALIPLAGLNDPAAVAHALEPFRSQGVHYVDLRQESTRLVRGYRQEAITLLGAGLGGIALILALGLRSTAAAAQTLIPVLAAGLCTALAMALLSGGLTLYHVVSLLLVLGLSLDQALFFNRDAADPEERRRTLLSLLVCSSSSVLAFGTLALSDVNVLNSIGATVALGAFIAITFAALLARRPRLLA